MTIEVRSALPADGPALYEAWQALRVHNAAVDRRIIPAPVSRDEFVAGLGIVLERATSATFVAENESAMVGFVSGSIERNQPDRLPEQHVTVGYLYVEPAYRRLGIGRKLFDAISGWAAHTDGVSHFEMTVLAGDRQAAAFWRALGFSTFIERLWAPLVGREGGEE